MVYIGDIWLKYFLPEIYHPAYACSKLCQFFCWCGPWTIYDLIYQDRIWLKLIWPKALLSFHIFQKLCECFLFQPGEVVSSKLLHHAINERSFISSLLARQKTCSAQENSLRPWEHQVLAAVIDVISFLANRTYFSSNFIVFFALYCPPCGFKLRFVYNILRLWGLKAQYAVVTLNDVV